MSTLQHHGIEGQKWGVRRYQNPDGSLTPAGVRRYRRNSRKAYKKELKNDKLKRDDYESIAYNAAQVAEMYDRMRTSVGKRYQKLKARDPNENEKRTVIAKHEFAGLLTPTDYWRTVNSNAVDRLKRHVDGMIKKYSDTKIKDVKTKHTKYGNEVINSLSARLNNFNTNYMLVPHWDEDSLTWTYYPRLI